VADLTDKLETGADNVVARLERALQVALDTIATETLPQAQRMAAAEVAVSIRAALSEYDAAVDGLRDDLLAAAKLARDDIGEAFTAADAELINAMIDDTAAELRAAGITAASQISQTVYAGATGGMDKAAMVEQVRQLLVGGTDARGKPLSAHAGTIAETRYMQVFATTTKQLAERAGHERFRYSGTLVADSRPWCVQHLGKVLTKEEIAAWAGKDWAGKAPGDPFITRGGWRCRHYWHVVAD